MPISPSLCAAASASAAWRAMVLVADALPAIEAHWSRWAFALGLAGLAGYLFFTFVREHAEVGVAAVLAAVAGHGAFLWLLSLDLVSPTTASGRREFEVAIVQLPPSPTEPEPEPEADPEPEPEPEPTPDTPVEPTPEPPPKPKKQPKVPAPAPVADRPVSDASPPPPLRFDLSQATMSGNSGVAVQIGTPGGEGQGAEGGGGRPGSKGRGTQPKDSEIGTGVKWEPASEIFVKSFPEAIKVEKIKCPATAQLGVEGIVVLRVQVQRDGQVRSVKVAKGIGNGCDAVATKALKKARFRPATGTNGQAVDYELRYEYEFRLEN